MKILFAHGLESGPHGFKINYLKGLGHEVIAPSLPKDDFETSVQLIREQVDNVDLVIGSSRGGAVVMAVNPNKPMILLAPAWKRFKVDKKITNPQTSVIHGIFDEVIPVQDSYELQADLYETLDNHRLHESMNFIDLIISKI